MIVSDLLWIIVDRTAAAQDRIEAIEQLGVTRLQKKRELLSRQGREDAAKDLGDILPGTQELLGVIRSEDQVEVRSKRFSGL